MWMPYMWYQKVISALSPYGQRYPTLYSVAPLKPASV